MAEENDDNEYLRALIVQNESRSQRERRIFNDPKFIETVTAHVAGGGSLIGLSELWDINYGRMANFFTSTQERANAYNNAVRLRREWAMDGILRELRAIAHADIRLLYNDQGGLKPTKEWPDHVARAIESIESHEEFDEDGNSAGMTKKVKLGSKLKALELYGKTMAMYTERHEVQKSESLSDLVEASWKDVSETATPPKEVNKKTGI